MTITTHSVHDKFDHSDARLPAEISDGVPRTIIAETAGGISTEITAPWVRPDGIDTIACRLRPMTRVELEAVVRAHCSCPDFVRCMPRGPFGCDCGA
jgi:hypothetical protein